MDPHKKDLIRKTIGLVVGAFALFTLVACISYIFNWKADQSVLGDPQGMDKAASISNAAGKLGARWASLLVGGWFGVGAFALVVTLGAIACRLFFKQWHFSVFKAVLLSLAASLVISWIGSYIGVLMGNQTALGGGYGGECGTLVVTETINKIGTFMTGLVILIITVLWFVLASARFGRWFESLGEVKPKEPGTEEGEGDVALAPGLSLQGGEFPGDEGGSALEAENPDDTSSTADDAPSDSKRESGKASFGQKMKSFFLFLIGKDDDDDEDEEGDDTNEEGEDEGKGKDPLGNLPSGEGWDLPIEGDEDSEEVKPAAAPGQRPQVAAFSGDASTEIKVLSDGPVRRDPADPSSGVNPGRLEVQEGPALDTTIQEELTPFDVKDELREYEFPPLDLLGEHKENQHVVPEDELKRNNLRIRNALKTYKIEVDNVRAVMGPTVALYKVYPAPGVKIAAIKALQDDIAMALKATGVRVVTLNDSVGIEVPNDRPSMVPLRATINDENFRSSKAELPVAIGYATKSQSVKVFDLADAPHLLVAGATKQGKSVGLNVLISSLLYSKHPSELKFVFVDPKMVEFTAYSRLLKHYLAVLPSSGNEDEERENAIAKSPQQAEAVLKSLCIEMDERYKLLSKALVNKITLYNQKWKDRHLLPTEGHKFMPYLVVVVDEFADLTMASGDNKQTARSISNSIIRLAQKGRAAGIHVVLATQRPSVDVITGLIKSNFPTRIAFRTFSMTDSRTILDSPGAEKLIGNGDMIYYAGVNVERAQCAFISNDEINAVTKHIEGQVGYRKSYNTPYYLPAPEPDQVEDGSAMLDAHSLDERFEEAARLVVQSQRGSTSDLQRRLGMGYAKAGRVMDQLEQAGIVGPQEGSKPRQVLVDDLDELESILSALRSA